ncbi:hypothetical protein [Govanella unica]|uniref:Glycerophosphotransferase n=1 Tax=Govanella unica TaxID=2975056 RepID=A0A9X3Z7H4_9PROT|nr:hypothetical protein [Govania unica]MDA5194250.1 hypothetical protein [Govania unica]
MSKNDMSKTRKIAFLFNHDAPHQVAHGAPVAQELKERYPNFDVDLLVTSSELYEQARKVLGDVRETGLKVERLAASSIQAMIGTMANSVLPFSRISNLVRHRKTLAQYDALIVPEFTTLILKKLLGVNTPKLIYTGHGSGDRSVGFSRSAGKFDLVLLSGPKLSKRFVDSGFLREEQFKVVGYPKFDTVADRIGHKPRFFDNDRPTVLYNPHFEPKLSSYHRMGLEVLEYFYNSQDYNLIFAPHVMLFRKKVHISLENFYFRVRQDIPSKYFNCPHIRIDTGSPALMDMTYTLGADIYLGDVSSQIYEFLVQPRPSVFLNSHHAKWQGNPNYRCWSLGPVIEGTDDLGQALSNAREDRGGYFDRQRKLFAETFDLEERPSAERAAEAIADFLGEEPRQRLMAVA